MNPEANCPWEALDEEGNGLVDDFLTTMLSQLVNALRRTVTLPYAEQFELTVPEWRLLALLAHARQLPFAEQVMPLPSKGQAEVIRLLEPEERRAMYQALRKPHGLCVAPGRKDAIPGE
ncbi:hypothetical protein UB46_16850 [Burkholderiaceae bacterium 16]|nr:hypothetical protein UB46_16850 [Burkholderiaceae bacterium 16]